GNNTGGDGCSPSCVIELCFNCSGSPSVCTLTPDCVTTTTSTSSTTTTTTTLETTTTTTILETTTTTTTTLETTTTSSSTTTPTAPPTTTSSSTSSTVTSPSTSTSRTSTTAPPTGGACAGGCDDGDPCTDDACLDGVCRHTDVMGARHASCVCDRGPLPDCAGQAVSARFTSKVGKACSFLASGNAKKATRGAIRSWRAASKLLGKRAVVRGLSSACVTALKASVGDALGRTKTLLE